jgi:hypothetical protein
VLRRWPRFYIVGLVSAVACLDIVTGVRLMFASAPWLQNSHDTLWSRIPADAQANEAVLTLLYALYGRLGAFSFHVGVVTLIWAWWARTSVLRMRALLVIYALTGGAFFWFDREYFYGTSYFWLKTGISFAWTLALVLHFAFERSAPEPSRA